MHTFYSERVDAWSKICKNKNKHYFNVSIFIQYQMDMPNSGIKFLS